MDALASADEFFASLQADVGARGKEQAGSSDQYESTAQQVEYQADGAQWQKDGGQYEGTNDYASIPAQNGGGTAAENQEQQATPVANGEQTSTTRRRKNRSVNRHMFPS
jgi:hypothetical protein